MVKVEELPSGRLLFSEALWPSQFWTSLNMVVLASKSKKLVGCRLPVKEASANRSRGGWSPCCKQTGLTLQYCMHHQLRTETIHREASLVAVSESSLHPW